MTEDSSSPNDFLNEPEGTFQKRTLADIFKQIKVSTLEEEENEMRKYSASLTPEERMAYLYELNQRAFAHILEDPDIILWDKIIYIKPQE